MTCGIILIVVVDLEERPNTVDFDRAEVMFAVRIIGRECAKVSTASRILARTAGSSPSVMKMRPSLNDHRSASWSGAILFRRHSILLLTCGIRTISDGAARAGEASISKPRQSRTLAGCGGSIVLPARCPIGAVLSQRLVDFFNCQEWRCLHSH